MSEFKVGDKVKVVRPGVHQHALVGRIGVVTDTAAGNFWPYSVRFDDGLSEVFDHTEIELVVEEPEDAPDYGTSGEPNLTYQASDVPNHRVEALFAAIQSFQGWSYQPTGHDLTTRAEAFLKFLEGKDD